MKNKKGFVGGMVSVIIAVAIIVGGYFWWQKMSLKNLQETTQKATQETGVEINTQGNSPQALVDSVRDTVGKIEDEENSALAEADNIIVSSPKKEEAVSSPFSINGKARVFENVVSIRLKDDNGKTLFQGTAQAQSPDIGQFGTFKAEINYTTSESAGTLEVFQTSAKDGSEIDKIIIPVKFGNEQK
jgi:cytoskeletal protein RodZ